jgi:hypothetical protein
MMMNTDSPYTILRPDGSSLTFDGVLSETYSPRVEVTSHPIEDGSAVSDHAQRIPETFGARVVVTETPSAPRDGLTVGGPERIQTAIRFLESCVGELLLVGKVRTGLAVSVMLTGYPYTIDGNRRVIFDLSFKQVRIAQAATVEIPASKPPAATASGVASEVDAGQQATTSIPEGDAAAADDWSASYTLLRAAGLVDG